MCSVGKCVVGNGVPYFRHALLFPCSNAVLVTLLCSPRTPICFEKMDLLLIVLFCDANTGFRRWVWLYLFKAFFPQFSLCLYGMIKVLLSFMVYHFHDYESLYLLAWIVKLFLH